MPNGRGKYRKGYKRRYYRKNKRGYREPTMVSSISPVPSSFKTRMKYVTTYSLDPPAGLTAVYASMRANSIFDPEAGAGGHQALGMDQFSPLFDHYTVLGARIKCIFIPQGTTVATTNAICGIQLSDSVTPITTRDTWREQPRTVSKVTGSDVGRTTLTKTFSAKSFFGVKDVKDNDKLKSAVTTNPTEQAYFHVLVSGLDPSGFDEPAKVYVSVEMSYIVLFSEPKELTQS